MWGHMFLVGSILTGARGFDWLATMLEDYYIAQPTVLAIFALFLVHAVFAARKIPAQLRERKQILQLAKGLSRSGREKVATRTEYSPFRPHVESLLWIWQVRTGMVMLVLGSFHLVLLGMDIFTPLFGDIAGIESIDVNGQSARRSLVALRGAAVVCRVSRQRRPVPARDQMGCRSLLSRQTLHRIEQVIFWVVLVLGGVMLIVLAGWMDPPLAFLLEGGTS